MKVYATKIKPNKLLLIVPIILVIVFSILTMLFKAKLFDVLLLFSYAFLLAIISTINYKTIRYCSFKQKYHKLLLLQISTIFSVIINSLVIAMSLIRIIGDFAVIVCISPALFVYLLVLIDTVVNGKVNYTEISQ